VQDTNSEPVHSSHTHSHELGIVIVSWNTRAHLVDCLSSLAAAVGSLRTSVVVVDNASADGTPEMVRRDFPDVALIESGANIGFAAACNRGAANLDAEAILLLNPDTTCPPRSLQRLIDCLRRLPDAGVVAPVLVDGAGRPVASFGHFPRVRHHFAAAIDPAGNWLSPARRGGLGCTIAPDDGEGRESAAGCVRVDYVKGACFLMRRAAWDRVGSLDERFFLYFEETDWCRRARALGCETYLCRDVAVWHGEGGAAEQVSDFALAVFEESYRRYLAKHHGRVTLFATRLARILECGVKSVVRGLFSQRSAEDRELARRHRRRFALQFRNRIAIDPPDVSGDPTDTIPIEA